MTHEQIERSITALESIDRQLKLIVGALARKQGATKHQARKLKLVGMPTIIRNGVRIDAAGNPIKPEENQ